MIMKIKLSQLRNIIHEEVRRSTVIDEGYMSWPGAYYCLVCGQRSDGYEDYDVNDRQRVNPPWDCGNVECPSRTDINFPTIEREDQFTEDEPRHEDLKPNPSDWE